MILHKNETAEMAEIIKSNLYYDSGKVYNRVTRDFQNLKGERTGSRHGKGYRTIGINNCRFLEHRVVWLLCKGEWPLDQIDHKNRIRDDNRIENLRIASQRQNSMNSSISKNNKSGKTGVTWHKHTNKWRVRIRVDGQSIYLGLFKYKQDAINARKEAEKKYFGEFAP